MQRATIEISNPQNHYFDTLFNFRKQKSVLPIGTIMIKFQGSNPGTNKNLMKHQAQCHKNGNFKVDHLKKKYRSHFSTVLKIDSEGY